MKLPWESKTGLAKAATVLATVLLISFGLCGANAFAVVRFLSFNGSEAQRAQIRVVNSVLIFTGWVELVGILGSLLGLIICGVMAVIKSLRSGKAPPTTHEGKD